MNANNSFVQAGNLHVSYTSGGDIKGYQMCVFKLYNNVPRKMRGGLDCACAIRYGDLDGIIYATLEEARQASFERGYLKKSSRNTYKYVLSRAARKRGYTTDDYLYNSRRKRLSK